MSNLFSSEGSVIPPVSWSPVMITSVPGVRSAKSSAILTAASKSRISESYGFRIVVVAAVVDVRSLDHDEEPFVAVGR